MIAERDRDETGSPELDSWTVNRIVGGFRGDDRDVYTCVVFLFVSRDRPLAARDIASILQRWALLKRNESTVSTRTASQHNIRHATTTSRGSHHRRCPHTTCARGKLPRGKRSAARRDARLHGKREAARQGERRDSSPHPSAKPRPRSPERLLAHELTRSR